MRERFTRRGHESSWGQYLDSMTHAMISLGPDAASCKQLDVITYPDQHKKRCYLPKMWTDGY